MVREEILVDIISGVARQLTAHFHEASAGGQFGTASFTGPVSCRFRRRRMTEKTAVLAHGRLYPANGTAINACRPHRHKESPVEPRIPCPHRLIALIWIQS